MNRRSQVIFVLASVTVATLGWWIWIGRDLPADEGDALASGSTYGFGMMGIRPGDDVYWMLPSPINESDDEITFLAASPESASPGIELVDARIYQRTEFPASTPPLMWSSRGDALYDPTRVQSKPLRGQRLAAGASMADDLIFLHFRVTTNVLPASINGVRLEYKQGRKRHSQVVLANLTLKGPPPVK